MYWTFSFSLYIDYDSMQKSLTNYNFITKNAFYSKYLHVSTKIFPLLRQGYWNILSMWVFFKTQIKYMTFVTSFKYKDIATIRAFWIGWLPISLSHDYNKPEMWWWTLFIWFIIVSIFFTIYHQISTPNLYYTITVI